MFHLCTLALLTFTWEFSVLEFSVCLSVHWNSQKSVYYCLLKILWKCECCLKWALNKSILFGSCSLKISVLYDMNSVKSLYYSLIWKELWKCQYFLMQVLEMCTVLSEVLSSNSLKISVLSDMNSGKACSIVCQ